MKIMQKIGFDCQLFLSAIILKRVVASIQTYDIGLKKLQFDPNSAKYSNLILWFQFGLWFEPRFEFNLYI